MFIDCTTEDTPQSVRADICVIGSGPAALTLAKALAEANKTVVMVERGGKSARVPDRKVVFKASRYDGVLNGLAFGYGGTGVLWGGQLLPMLETELATWGSPWNSRAFAEEMRTHYGTVESWTGVSPTPYNRSLLAEARHAAQRLEWGSIDPLFSKWIPFRRRNLGHAWLGLLNHSKRVQVLLNLQPADFEFDEEDSEKTIRAAICRSRDGRAVRIEAKSFVIAAGALESPLILEKMLDAKEAQRLGVGRTLHDHLSLRVAEVKAYRRGAFEKLFGSFFTGNTMRSLRLSLPDSRNAHQGPATPAYCHFVIEAPNDSGFAVARDVLRGLQARNYANATRALARLPFALGDITRMGWARLVHQRLAISKGSRIFINVDFVQSPSPDNKIRSAGTLDAVEVDWQVADDIKGQADQALKTLGAFWEKNGLERIGKLEPMQFGDVQQHLSNIYDIYHPAGTCATGRVVDSELKIYGVSNGYVVGSSVFPMLGRSNPTLTIMALSLRLAERLKSLLGNPGERGPTKIVEQTGVSHA